jgi:uncharacterized protein (TIGR02996 family)
MRRVREGEEMSEESAFLDAVRTNPEDIATRLVYADWLEERGDARGEYLRLEAEVERIQARLQELRKQLDSGWLNVVSSHYLRYTTAYHLHCQLPLRSGRTITLKALDQRMIYADVLLGTPSQRTNDANIRAALQDAERYCVQSAQPHLIVPPRRDYRLTPGDMQDIAARSPHRIPEWLPEVRCIASFQSGVTARNPDMHLSVLTVVWYQDEYALPIREPALSQLLNLDWDALAVDIEL